MKVKPPHSLRSGCSITLELIGVPKQDIARHVGWRTPAMVDHCNHLHEALLVASPASVLTAGKLPTGDKTSEECVGFSSSVWLICRFAACDVPDIL